MTLPGAGSAGVPWPDEDVYALSPMQQGMLFHSLFGQQAGVDIDQMVYTLPEDLDVAAFRRAWQQAVDRHPILRSSFHWEGLEAPVQRVCRAAAPEWPGAPGHRV